MQSPRHWSLIGCVIVSRQYSLTPCSAQTIELTALAQERQVFLMEALWTVFLPLYDEVRRWLREGFIGHSRNVEKVVVTPDDSLGADGVKADGGQKEHQGVVGLRA